MMFEAYVQFRTRLVGLKYSLLSFSIPLKTLNVSRLVTGNANWAQPPVLSTGLISPLGDTANPLPSDPRPATFCPLKKVPVNLMCEVGTKSQSSEPKWELTDCPAIWLVLTWKP